jgi:membrane protease YdiL (CAAX protease family)
VKWPVVVGYLVASACGAMAVRYWIRERIPVWRGLGLGFDRDAVSDLLGGVLIGALVMGGIFGAEWVLGLLWVNGVLPPHVGFLTWLLTLALLAMAEEIVFRGLMLSGLVVLMRRRWLAVVVMAAFFGLVHAANPGASALSVLGNGLGGLMYAVAFLGTGRIWLPFGLHLAWNFFQGPVLGFPVSGLEIGGLVQQHTVGRSLLTGGGYGPEAGLVGMAFRFVAIALMAGWWTFRSGAVRRRRPSRDGT